MTPDSLPGGSPARRVIPAVSLTPARTGASTRANELGMRPMQARAYAHRGAQYLLIKSPPASGKSRALMFIALDKLANQGLSQAVIVVPERSIGASFADEALTQAGFWADWTVLPQWNLCNAPGADEPKVARSKVAAVREFLAGPDKVLVCTHATFRFAVEELGVAAFDNRLVAVDEFHHVSANPDNRLGAQLAELIARDRAHLVAMTGSYFRGDAEPVLLPSDEARFETVTYTYYEQLNGYEHLKSLRIGYFFYSGRYLDAIMQVLDPALKTIIHIPSVNSRESTRDKTREVEEIMDALGTWRGADPATGFHLIELPGGRTLRVADLVDDDPAKRERVSAALRDPAGRNNRAYVDIIIALGMAKEGFDWIWCEHALTVGYRSSLTEVIQIIGRATRDAPGKAEARFTNLIAEPDAAEALVVDAINDTLKAIAASLLMEQVLAPRFDFTPKDPGPNNNPNNNPNNGPGNDAGPRDGFDYGNDGYQPGRTNVGFSEADGQFHLEIKGLVTPESKEATRICREDLNEVITAFVQDRPALERGMFDPDIVPEELTQVRMGKIVRDRYPDLTASDQEAVRQHAIAALILTQGAARITAEAAGPASTGLGNTGPASAGPGNTGAGDGEIKANTAFIDGVRRFAMDVRELDIDLIDRINPFAAAYAVLAKAMSEATLKQVQAAINARKVNLTYDEARALTERALQFKRERGRLPELTAQDAWERRMAEGVAFLARYAADAARG